MDQKSKEESSKTQTTDEEILALAKKELLRDVKCASLRAEQFGAHSWAKPQNYVPSKRFLKNLLVSASRDNDRREYLTEKRKKHARRTYDSTEISNYSERDRTEIHVVKRSKKDLYSKEKTSKKDIYSKGRKTVKDLYHSSERKNEKDLYLKEGSSEKDFYSKRRKKSKMRDE